MERDNLIGQGAAFFLKDRLFENSDKFKMYVCNICGNISVDNKLTQKVACYACDNGEPVQIPIPYATKLLFQELMAMNMFPRMLTE